MLETTIASKFFEKVRMSPILLKGYKFFIQ